MPKIIYKRPKWLHRKIYEGGDVPRSQVESVAIINQSLDVLEKYAEAGYPLTLRQLYYQLVKLGTLSNTRNEYNRLKHAAVKGRMWGLIDWDHIVDHSRHYARHAHCEEPVEIIQAASQGFRLDRWADSKVHIEVWVQDWLHEHIARCACEPLDVGYLTCNGYMSISELWSAAQRAKRQIELGKSVVLLVVSNHTPSGTVMVDVISKRFKDFNVDVEVRSIALTAPQIEQHQLLPVPLRSSADSRNKKYIDQHGEYCWELDALDPFAFIGIIQDEIQRYMDASYYERVALEKTMRAQLGRAAEAWPDIVNFLEARDGQDEEA